MLIVVFLFWFFTSPFIAIDFNPTQLKTASLVAMIIALFKVSSLFQLAEAVRISWFGTLRGLKDTTFPLLASIIGFWAIPLPFGYLSFT